MEESMPATRALPGWSRPAEPPAGCASGPSREASEQARLQIDARINGARRLPDAAVMLKGRWGTDTCVYGFSDHQKGRLK